MLSRDTFLKKKVFKIIFFVIATTIPLWNANFLFAEDSMEYKTGEIIVKYKSDTKKPEDLIFYTNSLGEELKVEYIDQNHINYCIEGNNMEEMLEKFNNNPEVEYAQPNFKYSISQFPNDPYIPYEWGLEKIQAPKVWEINQRDEAFTVAIIDTGINISHPDLKEHIINGYNVIDGSADVQDDCGHGTHIAGITAAIADNGVGIAGVSGKSKILPVKVLDADGNGYSSDIATGIKWAVDQGVKIINLSLGGPNYDRYLQEAVEYAHSKDCILIAAAGNNATYKPTYPAALKNVIAVTAIDKNNQKCGFSNYGKYVDIAAPGKDIYSTSSDGGYEYRSGTSMACAFVSGTVALVWAGAPDKTLPEIETIIVKTASKLNSTDSKYNLGAGLIDAYNAYKIATGYEEPKIIDEEIIDEERVDEERVDEKTVDEEIIEVIAPEDIVPVN